MATTSKARKSTSKPVAPPAPSLPSKILVIDIGGTKLKILASGQTEARTATSGKKLTPGRMVEIVTDLAKDWEYEAVSIGFPGQVGLHGPRSEPGNLASGWVGFDFASAFDKPVRITNDAAMQALGSYEGGRMLFLGLGTGLGSALIADHVIVPLELGDLPYREGAALGSLVGRRGLAKLGKEAWRGIVAEAVVALGRAFVADHIVLGGGNAKLVKTLPPGTRLGNNLTAFRGGFRLWSLEDVPTLDTDSGHPVPTRAPAEWRMI